MAEDDLTRAELRWCHVLVAAISCAIGSMRPGLTSGEVLLLCWTVSGVVLFGYRALKNRRR